MRRNDILILESQIDLLERESKILKEAFNEKDLKRFKLSKENIFRAQSKIKKLIK